MKRKRAGRALPPPTAANVERRDSPDEGSLLVVGVGASAGGLEAFSALLTHLPLDTGMGFVLVQHLDPEHESALPQLLSRVTSLPVHEVTNNMRVERNHVYVIPPNTNLLIDAGVLALGPRPKTRQPHRSIDAFLESLAGDQRERAIGVILSGTATDGTLGLEAIKAEGGITFAQDDSARYDSMPRSAVAAGCVDFVLSPAGIAQELARIAKHPAVLDGSLGSPTRAEDDRAVVTAHEDDDTALPSGGRGTRANDAAQARVEADDGRAEVAQTRPEDDGFKKILMLLRNHAGVDFSLYKSSTIRRRIVRRMVLTRHESLDQYARFLRLDVKELNALYSDTLISVTGFFRNPESFDVLPRLVWPGLLQQHNDEPIRVWVLGCSTGQEAYSIAMSFVEATDTAPRTRKLQVFATDLNDALLEKARNGLYAKTVAQDLSGERLRRFFVEEEGGYRIAKALREMVVFARQNVMNDPPFSRMDLISCRNLLIYFEPALQQKMFPVFHYALKPDGFLYLGASESIGGFAELFEPVDKKHKIYAKKAAPTPPFHLPTRREIATPVPAGTSTSRKSPVLATQVEGVTDAFRAELRAQREADRVAVQKFSPPAVLINGDLQILQFRGDTSAYLAPPAGKATFNVLKMARPGLMLPLRSAINKAKKDNKTARKEHITVDRQGTPAPVHVEVIPLKNLEERCFLIVFEEAGRPPRYRPRPPARAAGGSRGTESGRIAALESELAEMREYLQSIQEQHEAANEELQASNEEVQSANEELQSVNEELETSKEELESANEELTTVNDEMTSRNTELNRLNNDLVNVQTATNQAIVLLDRNLLIRRFSAQAERQFSLLSADVGKPFTSVRHNLDIPDLGRIVSEVIDSVRATEHEVQDTDGRWFFLRVRPYLTIEGKVDGAVLVLIDVNDLKRNELAARVARDFAEAIIRTARDPLLVLNADLRVHAANDAFYKTFKVSPAESEERLVYDLGNRQWDIPRLRELLEDVLPSRTVFDDFEITHSFEQLGTRTMLLNARRLNTAEGQPAQILLGIQDVTAAVDMQNAVRQIQERYHALVDASAEIVWTTNAHGAVTEDSPSWRAFTGQTREQREGSGWLDAIHPDDRARVQELWRRSVADRHPLHTEYRLRHVSGDWRWSLVRAVPIVNPDGAVREWVGMNADITERKDAEFALRAADRRKNEFLAMLAHELRNPLAPILVSIEILRRWREAAEGSEASRETNDPQAPASGDPGGRVGHAMEVLERQVGHMVRLVDDLLDIGRISRGKIELRRQPIELSSVVGDVVDAVRPLVKRLDHELTVTVSDESIYLDADAARLAQALGNLLTNACKFTPRGGHISLSVEREQASNAGGTSQHGPQVAIRVRDDGIGIAADQIERVFEMFTQLDTTMGRTQPGLGIGLSLAKSLIGLHEGTIDVTSGGPGQGTTFVVRLPIMDDADVPEPAAMSPEPTVTTPLRILIVDDNRDSTEMLEIVMKAQGHEVYTAHDGVAAVAEAGRLHPDVILLDIGLPGLDGYEVARRIRQQNREADRPLVVALTGWGQDEDRSRSKEAGFDAHVVKPIDSVALGRLLVELGADNRTVEP